MSRLVLYSLSTDENKAKRLASLAPDATYAATIPPVPPDAHVIKMVFKVSTNRNGLPYGYVLSATTASQIKDAIGNGVQSVIIIMHGGAGKLSPAGAKDTSHHDIASPAVWKMDDVVALLQACNPQSVYFLACKFGTKPAASGSVPEADGPGYLDIRLPPGVKLYCSTSTVMCNVGAKPLHPDAYERKITSSGGVQAVALN